MAELGSFDIARKTLYWGISGVILSLLVLGLVILILSYRGAATEVPPLLESTILSARFVNSPKCFAYQDSVTERVEPRLIDLTRFTDEVMAGCYISDTTKDYQFQLKLRDLDTDEERVVQTAEWYNVPAFTLTEPVLIKKGEEIHKGVLLIIVQKPV